MTKRIALALIMAAALARPAAAQTADHKAVEQTVESFLLHLGDHEYDKGAADLTPKALIAITRDRDGQWSNTFQTGEEGIAALKKNPNPGTFREPITNVRGTIDPRHLPFLRG